MTTTPALTQDHIDGACNCASSIDVNETVWTPDMGIGTVRVLMEHTAEVQINAADENWTTDSFTYQLTSLHLTDSALANKDAS